MMIIKLSIMIMVFPYLIFSTITLKRYSTSTFINMNTLNKSGQNVQSNEAQSSLSVLRVGFRQYANPFISSGSLLSFDNRLTLTDEIDQMVYKGPLVFPNPWSIKSVNLSVGFVLSYASDIQIQIYDMFGHLMYKKDFIAGLTGKTSMGRNLIEISPEDFRYFDISAGVYFLILIGENNQVLGKTKFAIIPDALN
jgi:hypothetical protein